MTKGPLRVAMIGAGAISEQHLMALARIPSATVVGVCDLSPALGRYAVERFGIPHAFTDHRRMLAETEPDVVHVLTPPATHVPISTECLNAGAHVIVEKPITLTHAEFCELRAVAESVGRWIVEDHNYRFNAPVLELARLVRDGVLGEVSEIEVRLALNIIGPGGQFTDASMPHPSHRLPAGAIHEFLSHLGYLALHFFPDEAALDAPFDRVTAAWSNHRGGELFRFDDLDATIIVGGAHARIRSTAATWPDGFGITVRGDRGTASTDLFLPCLQLSRQRGLGPLEGIVGLLDNGFRMMRRSVGNLWDKIAQKTAYGGLGTFLEQTYDAFARGTEPPVTYRDMDRLSRLLDALLDEANRR